MPKPTVNLRPNNLHYLRRDRGYRWTDQDPAMADMTCRITESNLSIREVCDRVYELTGHSYRPSEQTLYNWQNGTTKNTYNRILELVGLALNIERLWQPKQRR